MDQHAQWVMDKKIERTIENLEKNNMNGHYVKDQKELLAKLPSLLEDCKVVSAGGSMSLGQAGVLDFLRNADYEFLDRTQPGTDIQKIYRDTFSADAYFASTNALTEEGELYNVDGTGNRVAAMIFGPKKVILIVGINKIVGDINDAIERNRTVAAPANAKRLNKKTPCAELGYCTDCDSPDRICNDYVIIGRQGPVNKDRIHVVIVGENLGY